MVNSQTMHERLTSQQLHSGSQDVNYIVDGTDEVTDSMVENEDIIAALSSSDAEPEQSRYTCSQTTDRSPLSHQFQTRHAEN